VKYLIDTNVLIPLEPTAPMEIERLTPAAIRFVQSANRSGFPLFVHPAQLADVAADGNDERCRLRLALLQKYPSLPNPPSATTINRVLGEPTAATNDWVDHQLLAALYSDAVDYLVTEDVRIHRKAKRLQLHHRVAYVLEAITALDALCETVPPALPAVTSTKAHNIDAADPIFASVREDYPEFDDWLIKCKREHRQAWLVTAPDKTYAGVSIVNAEQRPEFRTTEKTLKICIIKISEAHSGFKYGELLLREVLHYAEQNGFDLLFVEVWPRHEQLVSFLNEFGFYDLNLNTERGELRLGKRLNPTEHELAKLEPLELNKQFGPTAMKWSDTTAFIVPIKPKYHDTLFPEATVQSHFFEGRSACSNALRKAYLCNSVSREIKPGAILVFYRSEDWQTLTVLGVAEETLRSNSATEIARFVGKRTVYPLREIEALCKQPVLAILFRQSRVLADPIKLDKLLQHKIIAAAPQSITKLTVAARKWIQKQILTQ
jgi:ribosomal protein S18 acetylase RimI-like enzyme